MEKILCIHQSAELYGSDRSFYSAVEGLNEINKVDVILPFYGDLSVLLENSSIKTMYYDKGILRKKDLKKAFSFCVNTIKGIFFYTKLYNRYDKIYINTVVMLSAIIASYFYRFVKSKKIYCHVREIPSPGQLIIFKILFILSGVKLIYNSHATQQAFKLPGQVIYNGVPDVFSSNDNSPGESEKINLLLIGRINTWKGHKLLISALAGLKVEYKDKFNYKIRIVGSAFDGYEYLETELNEEVKTSDLVEDVIFYNFSKNPTDHFRWADYVIVPSTKPEPFGRVAVEAFSAAKPVIAANHGGLSEIVSDGINGYLFEPNNITSLQAALIKTSECSETQYKLLSKNARKAYENSFSEKKYQNSIKKVFLGNS